MCKYYKQIPFTSLADCWKHKMSFNIHRDDFRVCNEYKKKGKRNIK